LTALDKLNITEYQPKEKKAAKGLLVNTKGMSIEFNQVEFYYNPQQPIFPTLNFVIQPCEKICVSGKDGSGKSTFIRLLSTIYTANSGTILYNEIPLNTYRLDELRQHIGLMFNRLDVFNGTLFENITIGNPQLNIEDILPVSKKIGLDKYVNSLENGYETAIETNGKRLPRTIVKKIQFLRAIASRNPFIILEEPFSEIEDSAKQSMQHIILHELPQSTVVVVCNEPEFIRQCNRNFNLDNIHLSITNNLNNK
jgi:ABC-type multidrug transport system fused ATPase/permease subunit